MSTGQALGVVGGGVGFYFGGAQGAQWGFLIGSTVGNVIDPQRIRGPSLGDGQTQYSQDGVPRNIIYGTMACRGNVIDRGPLIKKIVEEEQGKGGGPVVETERFYMSYAVAIAESAEGTPSEIIAIRRVWRDEKLVYDASDIVNRPEVSGSAWQRFLVSQAALSASFASKVAFYTGKETQLPDPVLEAIHGVGNTPAYRGTAYMRVNLDDLTDRNGAIPDYRFEVVTRGSISSVTNVIPVSTQVGDLFHSGALNGKKSNAKVFGIASDAAIVFRATNFIISDVGRVRIVPLYYTPAGYDAVAQPIHYALADDGAAYDSGWFASSQFIAQEFTNYEIEQGRFPPYVTVGTPPAFAFRSGRKVLGMLILTEMYHNGNATVSVDVSWPQITGGLNFSVDDGVPGVLVSSTGVLYWPAWAASTATVRVTQELVPLDTIVADLAARAGVKPLNIDVTALSTYLVRGFMVARQMTAADAVRGLQTPYLFDMPEWDSKIRAVRRGGSIMADITGDDLVAEEDEENTRAQPVDFPRKLHVVYPDPTANYVNTKQTSPRRISRRVSDVEVTVEAAVSMLPDEAAQLADTLHKVTWSSAEGAKRLTLPDQWSFLTPSDAITYAGKRWRLEEAERRDGMCAFRARYDRATDYGSKATGIFKPLTPIFQEPVGTTLLEILNIPVLAETDDDVGLYVAARGTSNAWSGALLSVSIDNGISFTDIATVSKTANMGYATTAILAEQKNYPSRQTLTVSLPNTPDAVTYDVMMRYRNRALIGTEIIQFQTVTPLGGDLYQLGGIIRGLYDTAAAAHTVGERFIILDSSVSFIRVPRAMIGQLLQIRAVTSGASSASAPIYPYSFSRAVSQTEWAPHLVTARRDVANTVTVSWAGRGRIGPEINPYRSQFWQTFRVVFSDGFTVDTTASTLSRASVPAGVTITVYEVNSITGAGPVSEGITI